MNNEEAIRILNNAIHGVPNSCLSEHACQLAEVRDYLRATALAVVADAPRPPPTPTIDWKALWIAELKLPFHHWEK